MLNMQKETIDKANEIIELIKENERAIEELLKYTDNGGSLYAEQRLSGMIYPFYNKIHFGKLD